MILDGDAVSVKLIASEPLFGQSIVDAESDEVLGLAHLEDGTTALTIYRTDGSTPRLKRLAQNRTFSGPDDTGSVRGTLRWAATFAGGRPQVVVSEVAPTGVDSIVYLERAVRSGDWSRFPVAAVEVDGWDHAAMVPLAVVRDGSGSSFLDFTSLARFEPPLLVRLAVDDVCR